MAAAPILAGSTYTWMPDAASAFTIEVNGKHYVDAMDAELKSKGLSLVKENADFSIQTHRVTSHRDEYKSVSGGVDFPKATLQVEFFNPATSKPIWEGTAELYISEHAATRESRKAIYDAVGTLLKDFPPGVND